MVRLAITADCWDSVWKVKKQLEELSIPESNSVKISSDGKIFFETSAKVLLERVVCLSMVERVFLCLHQEELHEHHELCKTGPNYGLLQDWVYGIDWIAAFQVIDLLHGTRPHTWMLDSKRHGSRGSPTRAFDRLVMQQKVRDVLHEVLAHFGCRHDPYGTLMIYVFISGTLGFIAVPLLHRRVKQGYFPHKGLHHSLCWGLAATAALKAGDVVIDPMAGKGVILLEASAFWPSCCFLGLELSKQQLACACENLRYAKDRGVLPCASISFVQADSCRLPLVTGSVDVVLCDLPFGRQYGAEDANPELYTAALLEVARVLRPLTGRAILITASTDMNKLAMQSAIWSAKLQLVKCVGFRFGGNHDRLRCAMYCLAAAASPQSCTSLFDWSCVDRMQKVAGSEDLVWKAAKPLLQVYIPLKAYEVSGQTREKVGAQQSARERFAGRQMQDENVEPPAQEHTRPDKQSGVLKSLRGATRNGVDEMDTPYFFYAAHKLNAGQ